MGISYGARTDVGAHRELNEDAVLATPQLFVVADGMGGHAAGEVAAAIAVRQLEDLARQESLTAGDITRALLDANRSILAEEATDDSKSGMGTTVTGMCLGSLAGTPHWFVFNVGDSRVYKYANTRLVQITEDHSEVAELVAGGHITADAARTHNLRNVITRSLGTTPPPSPDMWVLPVVAGERFVLCSDGLSSELTDDAIAHVLRLGLAAEDTADLLVQGALQAGGHDNVSVVVVDVPLSPDDAHDVEVRTLPRRRTGA